jgi:hypothetical protein
LKISDYVTLSAQRKCHPWATIHKHSVARCDGIQGIL